MSSVVAPGVPVPSGLRGVVRLWLRGWSSEFGKLSEVLPIEPGRPNAHSYGSVRVLVVDDNPVNLMMISALMERRGLVPVLAADGAEAVALACEMHFDLILMDLEMPILGGLKATAAIRRFENTGAWPAVPIVAYSLASPDAGALAAHGMNGSLAKPCRDQDLEDCLVQWCPTYHSAPIVCDAPDDNSRWHAVNQTHDSSSTPLR